MTVDLFCSFKMINKAAKKLEDFSKSTNKIIVSVVRQKCFWNRNRK